MGQLHYEKLRDGQVEGTLEDWVTPQLARWLMASSAATSQAAASKALLDLLTAFVSVLHLSSLWVSSIDHSSINPQHWAFQMPPCPYTSSSSPASAGAQASGCPPLCLIVDKHQVAKLSGFSYKKGYLSLMLGMDADGGKVWERAHRLVLLALCGPPVGGWDPKTIIVCQHLCHTKNCLNPLHLKWGSKQSNHFKHQGKAKGLTEQDITKAREAVM